VRVASVRFSFSTVREPISCYTFILGVESFISLEINNIYKGVTHPRGRVFSIPGTSIKLLLMSANLLLEVNLSEKNFS